MPDTMRGVYTNLTDIRRSVFREVAKICYSMDPASGKTDDDLDREFDELPFKILPGDVATYRESVFLERAIIGERIRLAMGLPLSSMDKPSRVSEGFSEAETGDQVYYQPPLINVIKFACNACKDNVYMVSDACQGCLAHPCREICPKKAISFKDKKAFIDQDACIKCGMCAKTCPYHAIHHYERPCAAACGMHAIGSDEHGRAEIDYEKCVSCGQCLINCPFGAIADKSQIGQVIWAINSGQEVIAAVAPAFASSFTWPALAMEEASLPLPVSSSFSLPAPLLSSASSFLFVDAEATFFTERRSTASMVMSFVTVMFLAEAAMSAFVSVFSTVMATLPATPTSAAPAPAMAWVSMMWPSAFSSASRPTSALSSSLPMAAFVSVTAAFLTAARMPSLIFVPKSGAVRPSIRTS